MQHRLALAVQGVLGPSAVETLAMRLSVSRRTAQRLLSGEHLAKLNEIVELAALVGDSVLIALPRTSRDMFPDEYRALLSAWDPQSGQLPSLALPDVTDQDLWEQAVGLHSSWLAREADAQRATFIDASVAAHQLVTCLASVGLPSTYVLPQRTDVPFGWAAFRIVTRTPSHVWVAHQAQDSLDPVTGVVSLFEGLYQLEAQPGASLAVITLGPLLEAQLHLHAPQGCNLGAGQEWLLPFQTAGQLGVAFASQADAPDLAITVLAEARRSTLAHYVWLVGKAGS